MRKKLSPSPAQEINRTEKLGLRVEPILKGAVLSPTGLQLPENTSFEQWADIGRELGRLQKAVLWAIGDWWAFGEHKWGDRKKIVESEDWGGPAFGTCANAATVCRAFGETSRRREVLSFNHHVEVATFNPAEADSLLDWCETPVKNGAKPQSIRALREELTQRGLRLVKSAALPDSTDTAEGGEDEDEENGEEEPSSKRVIHRTIQLPLETVLKLMGTEYVDKVCQALDERATDAEERQRLIIILLADFERLREQAKDHFFPKTENGSGE